VSRTLTTQVTEAATVVSLRPRWRMPWRLAGWGLVVFGVLGAVGAAAQWNTTPEMRGALVASLICVAAGLWVAEWLMQTVQIAVTEGELRFTRQFSLGQWRRSVPVARVQSVNRSYRTPERNHRHGEWRLECWTDTNTCWRAAVATERDAWVAQRMLRSKLGHPDAVEPSGHAEQELRSRVPGTVTRW
jgi:membrane protein YdbS with pleckstrin-like domain